METYELDQGGLLTGDPTVDRQHEEVIRRAATLRTAIQEGRGACEVAELLAFLDDYTTLHFSSEEALMASVGFPGLAGHHREHTALLEPIRALEREFRATGPTQSMVLRLNEAISQRFVRHVLSADQVFASYVQARQPDGRREAPGG